MSETETRAMFSPTDAQIDEAAMHAAKETAADECPDFRCGHARGECPLCAWWGRKCVEAGVDPDSLVVADQAAS